VSCLADVNSDANLANQLSDARNDLDVAPGSAGKATRLSLLRFGWPVTIGSAMMALR